MKKLGILAMTVLLAGTVSACTKQETVSSNQEITLNYWGVYEQKENFDELINEFQASNPNVKINYTRKGFKDYKQQIMARAGQDNGPDIFRFHNSWVPELRAVLATTPQNISEQVNISKNMYPVVDYDLNSGKGYYGIPLMYDGLGLFYNKKLFQQAGMSKPPDKWPNVINAAKELRAPQTGQMQVAGLALGSTNNVDYWQDIVSLLMIQNQASILDPVSTRENSDTAVGYFRKGIGEFAIWDKNFLNSTESFAQGKVAMIFGTSWTAFEINNRNRDLDFGVVPVPQIPATKVGLASYWIEGVTSKASVQKQEAGWKFLAFLSTKENQQRLYAIQGKTRLFGEPFSNMELADQIQGNQYLGGIIETAPNAKSSYLSDKTFGEGMNTELNQIYEKYVNAGANVDDTSLNLQTVVKKYQLAP